MHITSQRERRDLYRSSGRHNVPGSAVVVRAWWQWLPILIRRLIVLAWLNYCNNRRLIFGLKLIFQTTITTTRAFVFTLRICPQIMSSFLSRVQRWNSDWLIKRTGETNELFWIRGKFILHYLQLYYTLNISLIFCLFNRNFPERSSSFRIRLRSSMIPKRY